MSAATSTILRRQTARQDHTASRSMFEQSLTSQRTELWPASNLLTICHPSRPARIEENRDARPVPAPAPACRGCGDSVGSGGEMGRVAVMRRPARTPKRRGTGHVIESPPSTEDVVAEPYVNSRKTKGRSIHRFSSGPCPLLSGMPSSQLSIKHKNLADSIGLV